MICVLVGISPTDMLYPRLMANPRQKNCRMVNPWMMANPRRSHNFQIRKKYYQTLINILNHILKHTRRKISSWLLLPKAPAFSSPCFSWLQEATSRRSWHTLLSKPDLSSRLPWISIALTPLIQLVQDTGELDISFVSALVQRQASESFSPASANSHQKPSRSAKPYSHSEKPDRQTDRQTDDWLTNRLTDWRTHRIMAFSVLLLLLHIH